MALEATAHMYLWDPEGQIWQDPFESDLTYFGPMTKCVCPIGGVLPPLLWRRRQNAVFLAEHAMNLLGRGMNRNTGCDYELAYRLLQRWYGSVGGVKWTCLSAALRFKQSQTPKNYLGNYKIGSKHQIVATIFKHPWLPHLGEYDDFRAWWKDPIRFPLQIEQAPTNVPTDVIYRLSERYKIEHFLCTRDVPMTVICILIQAEYFVLDLFYITPQDLLDIGINSKYHAKILPRHAELEWMDESQCACCQQHVPSGWFYRDDQISLDFPTTHGFFM